MGRVGLVVMRQTDRQTGLGRLHDGGSGRSLGRWRLQLAGKRLNRPRPLPRAWAVAPLGECRLV